MRTIRKYGLLTFVVLLFVISVVRYISNHTTVSYNPSGREMAIYSVETERPMVAITFDTAGGNESIQEILSVLQEKGVRASFFVTGRWVERYPEELRMIVRAGHDVGNHSRSHRSMSQLSLDESGRELLSVHKKVREVAGVEMDLFRPPYGDYNHDIIRMAQGYGYHTVQYSVSSYDWKDYGVERIVRAVSGSRDLQNGAIIFLTTDAVYTAEALRDVIQNLRQQGYEMVPVSELIHRENYYLDANGRQIRK